MNQWVYDGENFNRIQQALGKRPGNYRVDPFYLRRGIAQKIYFWNDYDRKWMLVHMGDLFWLNNEGKPVKTGMKDYGQEAG